MAAKRERLLTVRFTDMEYDALVKDAGDMKLSEFVRACLAKTSRNRMKLLHLRQAKDSLVQASKYLAWLEDDFLKRSPGE